MRDILLAVSIFLLAFMVLFQRDEGGEWSSRKVILMLVIIYGASLLFYFVPSGYFLRGDGPGHLSKIWLWQDIIKKGELPIWTNYWYLGCPLTLHYGFLYYLASAVFSLIISNDILLGTKIFLWILHVLSGITMFLFAKRLFCRNLPAIFASVSYVYSYQHSGSILNNGALPLSLLFLLIPLLFYYAEDCWGRKKFTFNSVVITSVVLALLTFNHLQYAYYATQGFLLFFSIRSLLEFVIFRNMEVLKGRISFLSLVLALFLSYTAWIILPMIFESSNLTISSGTYLMDRLISHSFLQSLGATCRILGRPIFPDEFWYSYQYVGVSLLFLSAVSFCFHRKLEKGIVRQKYFSFLIAFIIGSFYMVHSVRFINVWLFFMSILVGYGVMGISKRYGRSLFLRGSFIAAIIMVIISADLGPTLLINHFSGPLSSDEKLAGVKRQKLKKIRTELTQRKKIGRVIFLHKSWQTLWRGYDVVFGVKTPFGGWPEGATKSHPYVLAVTTKASVEGLDHNSEFSKLTTDGFRMFNITHVVFPHSGRIVQIMNTCPIFFSKKVIQNSQIDQRLENMPFNKFEPGLLERIIDYSITDRIIGSMKLSENQPIAEMFILHEDSKNILHDENKGRTRENEEFTVTSVRETHDSFSANYYSSEDGYIRAAYSYFPYSSVKIDGGRTDNVYRSIMNFFVVKVPAGNHTLEIRYSISPLRMLLILISILSFIASIGFSYIKRKKYVQ